MNRMNYNQVTLIIESLYESEISCRIEWMFDSGFVWSIQDGKVFPRLCKDEQMNGSIKIIAETDDHEQSRNNPLLEKDWIARGSNYSLKDAIQQLADKVCELYPKCKLAEWYIIENRRK